MILANLFYFYYILAKHILKFLVVIAQDFINKYKKHLHTILFLHRKSKNIYKFTTASNTYYRFRIVLSLRMPILKYLHYTGRE
jgi:hypothetical protein